MRYFYKNTETKALPYGHYIYACDHPVYNECSLYLANNKGLAIIQQNFNANTKMTFWSSVQEDIFADIISHKDFIKYYNSKAGDPIDGLFPTVTVRQVMWALRMKPIKREQWETCFDRSPI